ncbi:MAG: hypothetical protein QM756_06225 [Polyangiaceae bacterium]
MATGKAPVITLTDWNELLAAALSGAVVHGELGGEAQVVTVLTAHRDGISKAARNLSSVELHDAAVERARGVAALTLVAAVADVNGAVIGAIEGFLPMELATGNPRTVRRPRPQPTARDRRGLYGTRMIFVMS